MMYPSVEQAPPPSLIDTTRAADPADAARAGRSALAQLAALARRPRPDGDSAESAQPHEEVDADKIVERLIAEQLLVDLSTKPGRKRFASALFAGSAVALQMSVRVSACGPVRRAQSRRGAYAPWHNLCAGAACASHLAFLYNVMGCMQGAHVLQACSAHGSRVHRPHTRPGAASGLSSGFTQRGYVRIPPVSLMRTRVCDGNQSGWRSNGTGWDTAHACHVTRTSNSRAACAAG